MFDDPGRPRRNTGVIAGVIAVLVVAVVLIVAFALPHGDRARQNTAAQVVPSTSGASQDGQTQIAPKAPGDSGSAGTAGLPERK